MTIISYLAYPADNSAASCAPKNVITVVSFDIRDPKNRTKDELYIGFTHINRCNWKYITPRYHFEYKQDALSGSIQLDEALHVGAGTMRDNDVEHPVNVGMAPSQYTIDRAWGEDCGVYVAEDGLEIIWDRSSDDWQSAVFDQDVIMFEYWFDGDMKSHVRFTFTAGPNPIEWQPEEYFFVPVITEDGIQIIFRTREPPPILGDYFPLKQSFEVDIFAQNILGGGSLHLDLSIFGDVYGIKGRRHNPPTAVGTYDLSKDGKKAGVLQINAIDLIINGLRAKNFKISGNKITWEGSSEAGHMTQPGFVEFSDNGDQIKSSSLGFTGRRLQ